MVKTCTQNGEVEKKFIASLQMLCDLNWDYI